MFKTLHLKAYLVAFKNLLRKNKNNNIKLKKMENHPNKSLAREQINNLLTKLIKILKVWHKS
jgi:hypothetical protein